MPKTSNTLRTFTCELRLQLVAKVAVALPTYAAERQGVSETAESVRDDMLPREFGRSRESAVDARSHGSSSRHSELSVARSMMIPHGIETWKFPFRFDRVFGLPF